MTNQMKPLTAIIITGNQALDALEKWLLKRHLRIVRDISVARLDGLDYWAFVVDVDWYYKYSERTGTWGFNVHDDGEITAIKVDDIEEVKS